MFKGTPKEQMKLKLRKFIFVVLNFGCHPWLHFCNLLHSTRWVCSQYCPLTKQCREKLSEKILCWVGIQTWGCWVGSMSASSVLRSLPLSWGKLTVFSSVGSANDWWDTAGRSSCWEGVGQTLSGQTNRYSTSSYYSIYYFESSSCYCCWTGYHKSAEVQTQLKKKISWFFLYRISLADKLIYIKIEHFIDLLKRGLLIYSIIVCRG